MNKKVNYSAIITFALAIMVGFGSCKKKSDDLNPEVTASMSATINAIDEADGTTIVDSKDWTAITRVSIMTGEALTITGTELSLTPDVMNVTIYGTTEGTYKLGIQDVAAECGCVLNTTYNNATAVFASTSGTVVLTKVDKTAQRISGTYEFWLFSGGVYKTISNGKFENLKYEIK